MSFVLRHTFKPRLARARNAIEARAILNSGKSRTPRSVRVTPAFAGGVPGEWVESRSGGVAGILLYLHGGGYIACSPRTHRPITTGFAKLGFRVFAPEYRLAPEHPFPAAILDAAAAYRGIRAEAGPGKPIYMSGDSAGGGLALATMLKLGGEGHDLPAAAVLFSPFTDLAGADGSRRTNDRCCAMFHLEGLMHAAAYYMNGADSHDPLASPVLADLSGLPPLLIHVGSEETLLDDSIRLAERARAAGVQVELKIWRGVPHAWQLFHAFVPEGRQSLAAAAAFLKAKR